MASNMTLVQIYDNLDLNDAQKQIFYNMITQLEKSDDIVALAATSFKDVKEQILSEKVCEKCKDPKCSCAEKKDRKPGSVETEEEAKIRRKGLLQTVKMDYERMKHYEKSLNELRKKLGYTFVDEESTGYAYEILCSEFRHLQAIKVALLNAVYASKKSNK